MKYSYVDVELHEGATLGVELACVLEDCFDKTGTRVTFHSESLRLAHLVIPGGGEGRVREGGGRGWNSRWCGSSGDSH